MKLARLQQSFQAHLLCGDAGIADEIAGVDCAAIALRLGVYCEAYTGRLTEVLGETFPAVQAALGMRLFGLLVEEFAHEHASENRSARDYGAQLPPWLGARLHGTRAPGIADLARLEWALAAAFDAAEEAALPPKSLAGIEPTLWPQLQFGFTPSLRLLSVTSNCVAGWRFACARAPRPHRWRSTCMQQWLVWRQELAVFYRRLSRAESQALDAALRGCAFGELCAQLPGQSEGGRATASRAATRAAVLLQCWFKAGLVVGVSLDGETLKTSPKITLQQRNT